MAVARPSNGRVAARSRPVAVYVAMSTVDAVGSGMFLPISALSLTVLMQVPTGRAGLVLTAGTVAGLLVGLAAGPVMQRVPAGYLLVGSLLLRALAMAGYALLHGVAAGLLVTAAGRVGSTLGRPASTALATKVAVDEEQVRLLARAHAWRNTAFGVGAAAAAVLVGGLGHTAYLIMIILNGGSYLAAALLARHLTRLAPQARVRVDRAASAGRVGVGAVLTDRVFLRVAASIALLSTQSALLTVALPLWLLVRAGGARAGALAAAAVVLNTVLVAAFQVRVSEGAQRPPVAVRLLRSGGALFAAGCLALLLERAGVPLLLVLGTAVVLITFAEMMVTAGSWGAALGFAPHHRPEQHIAAASWAQGLGEALSAGTVGTLAAVYGGAGWLATAAIFVLPVLVLPGRDGLRRPEPG